MAKSGNDYGVKMDYDTDFENFYEFKRSIKHKKRFHPDNPEMPDD